jgi:hypothetical protein
LISFREAGTLILLPLPQNIPTGTVTASFSLAVHELNELQASSSYLKLAQIRSDFGDCVYLVATAEPQVSSSALDKPVPWQLIHRHYSLPGDYSDDSSLESSTLMKDITWHNVEQILSDLVPSFKLWRDCAHLGTVYAHQPISFNIIDTALNLCNNLPFEKRISEAFQRSLFHELLLQYLGHDAVEQTVLDQLQPRLAAQTVTV